MTKSQHIKRFMGGRYTAQEVHAMHAFPQDAKCHGCQRRPNMRAITMAPVEDARRYYPDIAQMPIDLLMNLIVQIKGSDGLPLPYVRLGIVYSCFTCAKDMEKALAKLPSWVICEINKGPALERVISSGGTVT